MGVEFRQQTNSENRTGVATSYNLMRRHKKIWNRWRDKTVYRVAPQLIKLQDCFLRENSVKEQVKTFPKEVFRMFI